MKTSLVSLALLTVVSGTALGHQVFDQSCDDSAAAEASAPRAENISGVINAPGISNGRTGIGGATTGNKAAEASKCYASTPEANSLRGETPNAPETDRTAALTFCRMGGYANTVDCAKDIIDKGLADDATNCLNKFNEAASKRFSLVSHQIGNSSGGQGYWHSNYMYSQEDGMHRHEYSEPLKQAAANKFVAEQIEYRKSQEVTTSISISRTEVNTTDRSINGGVGTSTVGIQGGRTITNGSERTQGHESGPLPQSAIDEIKAWAEPYARANPWVAGYTPDRLCKQNEPTCHDATKGSVKNESYTPASKQNPTNNASGSSGKPTSPSRSESTPNKTPSTPRTTDTGGESPITTTDGGTWAGEPSKSDDGSLWADFSQDDPGNNPLGNCIFNAHREKIEHGTDKTYDNGGSADTRSDAQRKRDAETLLQKGICDEKYFGRDYCISWKKKREMIDSAPDALDKGPVIAPGQQRERPGYLHFDQDSLPIIIPDLGPNVVPGASGGNTKIPKLK